MKLPPSLARAHLVLSAGFLVSALAFAFSGWYQNSPIQWVLGVLAAFAAAGYSWWFRRKMRSGRVSSKPESAGSFLDQA